LEKSIRKPFQGVGNIVRFNWHFYAIAFAIILCFLFLKNYLTFQLQIIATIAIIIAANTIFISLVISYYIYDYSDLYKLDWLNFLNIKPNDTLVNIAAGFDETSTILQEKYPTCNMIVFDFYNAEKHTEISIERARKAYPVFPNTLSINTNNIPLSENSVDYIFLIFAAHEIRNTEERIIFFTQLQHAIRKEGIIIVTEHQRDLPNFIAYTIGFFHFYANKTWKTIFKKSSLNIQKEFKLNPFVNTFILTKNGITS
jgi:ubiquinone/menaquinone biosynthesis C-methylase UbiE